MDKELGQITFMETDKGLRIEISGDKLRERFGACCLPICCGDITKVDGVPKEKKEGNGKCC